MNFIHKLAIVLLLLLIQSSVVFSATEPTLNQQRESILYATLVTMGFENSMVIVTDNEVVVDYVILPLQSDVDLALQLQAIFIAATKVAPGTVLTVIKGRYDAEYSPMLVAAVPNDVTQKLIAEVIDPTTFWQLVAINDEALLDATERQERKGLRNSPRAQLHPPLTWRNRSFEITPEEMIDSLGTITGLGPVTIKQVNSAQPSLLKPLQETLLAVKMMDLLCQADDTEELASLLPWPGTKTMDLLLQTVYPKSMQTWFYAITRYKVSLNLLPPGMILNRLDATTFAHYFSERSGENGRKASPSQAYQRLLDRDEGSIQRQKLHSVFLESRGLTENQIEKKLNQYLWAKADAFLRNRLEAEYQRQLLRTKHQALIDYLWAQKRAELEAVRVAVLKMSS